jgi:tetratricopeptide (TPR) repeat protein
MAPPFDFGSSGAHVPEDKDQYVVDTPFGRGMVIRTRRTDNGCIVMREYELTNWKPSTDRRPALLFSPVDFPSIAPKVKDEVVTQFGRGTVVALSESRVEVRISNWRLAGRSVVTCYLAANAVKVVRPKLIYEMSIVEKIEFAQELKLKASEQFGAKMYEQALKTYATAVDAVRYVQHKLDSTNEVRADLLIVMITCCNNAGTCCKQLQRYDEAYKFGKNALVLNEALENKKGMKIHTLLNREGYSDAKLFAEWMVKSYLLMAGALYEQQKDTDECMEILKKAHETVAKYTAAEYASNQSFQMSVKSLLSSAKEIIRLYQACKARRKKEKEHEKKRARAMFASPKTTKEQMSVETPPEKPQERQQASSPTSVIDGNDGPMKRKVSFSADTKDENGVIPSSRDVENDTMYEYIGFVAIAAIGAALVCSYLSRKSP